MRTSDHVQIIEAAYALDIPDSRWQYQLTELIAKQWGGTAASLTYDATAASPIVCTRVIIKTPEQRSISDAPVAVRMDDPGFRLALFGQPPHLAQLASLVGPDFRDHLDYRSMLQALPELDSTRFSTVLRSLAPDRTGLLFALPCQPVSHREGAMWNQIGVHLGLSYRLRRALAESMDSAGTDAPSNPYLVRQALRQAAHKVIEAKRTGWQSPDSAPDQRIWAGLVAGLWSLVPRPDSDSGEPRLIACRTPPAANDSHALTSLECLIARYLALGCADTLIGYSLALSPSSVSNHVSSISGKLGVPCRTELVRLLRNLSAGE